VVEEEPAARLGTLGRRRTWCTSHRAARGARRDAPTRTDAQRQIACQSRSQAVLTARLASRLLYALRCSMSGDSWPSVNSESGLFLDHGVQAVDARQRRIGE
jgi:hypothetical protein